MSVFLNSRPPLNQVNDLRKFSESRYLATYKAFHSGGAADFRE